ncbi:hypothetical protein B0T20DRAFT_401365 [Sordaria brevicollis]|uniref:Uncharacterized protein n=1 Tax=Sordaria brevicollis TaxID=83679 RepID=A0AAE0UGX5_SORBR|nr:hypothetical protein B0T20DRAFT_401365 [Sordaria brevicollis]
MFEVPDAKRVRRDELFGSAGSDRDSSPDTADEAEAEAKAQLLNAKLSSLLSLKFEFDGDVAEDDKATPAEKEVTKAPVAKKEEKIEKKKKKDTKQTEKKDDDSSSSDDESDSEDDTPMQDQPPQEEAEEAPEFEFRLFSTSAPSKIVLPSKEEEDGAGETIIADRPLSYYIRGELTPEQKEQFEAAAVTSQDIFNWAKQRAWGLEVPWRVKKIIVTVKGKGAEGAEILYGRHIVTGTEVQHQQATAGGEQQQSEKKKKKRLGKKGRIAFRIKEKARKEKEEAEQKKKMTKEEHLKEKKKRLNREKKLKRRQKEKEKKMAGKAGSSVGDAMSAVGQDSDSEGEKENKMEE